MRIITATPARTDGPRFYGRKRTEAFNTGLLWLSQPTPTLQTWLIAFREAMSLLPDDGLLRIFGFIPEHLLGSHNPFKNTQVPYLKPWRLGEFWKLEL